MPCRNLYSIKYCYSHLFLSQYKKENSLFLLYATFSSAETSCDICTVWFLFNISKQSSSAWSPKPSCEKYIVLGRQLKNWWRDIVFPVKAYLFAWSKKKHCPFTEFNLVENILKFVKLSLFVSSLAIRLNFHSVTLHYPILLHCTRQTYGQWFLTFGKM